MTIDVKIKDSAGKGIGLEIEKDCSARISDTGVPPVQDIYRLRPLSGYMTDSSGVSDMLVDGSTTSIDYAIRASNDADRYVHTLAFTIADAAASLNQFGNVSALTNGCQLIYKDDELGEVMIADTLQTNFDFVQMCNFNPNFGTGAAAFLASNVAGTSEAYIPLLDIENVFGLKYGILLPQGSNVQLILRIRDNVSTIDRFDVKAYGFDKIATKKIKA
jgi:hypothetical protein